MNSAQKEFDALIAKLETFSEKYPKKYRLRVTLFALLGYVYIFLVLAALLALIGAIIIISIFKQRTNIAVIKITVFLVILLLMILRSLWIRFPRPEGLRLSRRQVPRLFAIVDELSARLQAPRFHKILLTHEFNAAVIQVPRLGILGWQQNFLLLGLPLMQSLSPEQLKAVLAHELGHLSGNHSRLSGWIYRIRKTWLQVYEQLYQNEQVYAAFLFDWFLDWYWPAFDAYSFVLARRDEYEADACAAELVGKRHIAEALVNVEMKSRFLENSFWSSIRKQVQHYPDPPDNVYSSMLAALQCPIDEAKGKQWLEQALAQKTNNVDTHPCLIDRLKALGYLDRRIDQLSQFTSVKASAAEYFLENELQVLIGLFNQGWQKASLATWQHQHTYAQRLQKKLQALAEKAQVQELTDQEEWERAYCTLELQGKEVAFPLFQRVLKKQPNHKEANYIVGQMLLQRGDEMGIAQIEKGMQLRRGWLIDGCVSIYAFLCQKGQTAKAEEFNERTQYYYYQMLQRGEQERNDISDEDTFKPHSLKEHEIEALKQQLLNFPQIREAYLVEKDLKYFPGDRFCILGIVRKQGWFELGDPAQALVKLLVKNIQFPTEAYIVILNHTSSGNLKKMCQVPGSALW